MPKKKFKSARCTVLHCKRNRVCYNADQLREAYEAQGPTEYTT
jgi:hypothetical protein